MKAGQIVFGVGVAITAGYFWWSSRDTCDADAAYAAVKESISSRLRSPGSAIFQDWEGMSERTSPYICAFNISGYVDSQNGFGAMLRTDFWGSALVKEDGSISTAVQPKMILDPNFKIVP